MPDETARAALLALLRAVEGYGIPSRQYRLAREKAVRVLEGRRAPTGNAYGRYHAQQARLAEAEQEARG